MLIAFLACSEIPSASSTKEDQSNLAAIEQSENDTHHTNSSEVDTQNDSAVMNEPAQPASEPSQPSVEPASEPTTEPASEPSQPSVEPAVEPATEPASEPASEPAQPAVEPATEPASEPTSEPAQPASEPAVEPASEPASEPPPTVGYNLCGIGSLEPRPSGTLSDPISPSYLPLVDEGNTSSSTQSLWNSYDCAPTTDESGPEILYYFNAPSSGTFRAKLTDSTGVDIDIHLLQNPVETNGVVQGCIARGHEEIEVSGLSAGDYWVSADSWVNSSGSSFDGEYRLSFEWISEDQWNEIELTDGVLWKRMYYSNSYGGNQTINLIEIDFSYGHDLQPHNHGGCQTIDSAMNSIGAFAGINGGFFSSGCAGLDLLKADGVLHTTNTLHSSQGNSYQQRSLGWNTPTGFQWSWIDQQVDWSGVSNAIGGYPSLVTSGTVSAEIYPGQQVWSSTDWTDNPRTAIGTKADGTFMMVSVDGRTARGVGMTTTELGQLMADLGAVDALNLDGGGSTGMVVQDCWLNHVVSYPSDNSTPDHYGLRSVADGLYIKQ